MIKKILLIATIFFLALGAYFLFFQNNNIKIGVLFSSDTPAGTDAMLTVRLYEKMRQKQKTSPKIQFIYRNPSSNPESIAKKYKELAEQGVSLILAGELSKMGVHVTKEANRYKIPTILIGTSTSYITRKKDYVFSILSGTNLQSQWVSDYLFRKGSKKLMVFTSVFNSAYTKSYGDTLLKHFKGKVSVHVYKSTAQFDRIYKKENPDTLFMAMPANQILELMKFIKSNKYSLKTYSSEWLYLLFPEYQGKILNKVIIPTQVGILKPWVKEAKRDFLKLYDKKPSMYSEFTLSALSIMEQTLSQGYQKRKNILKFFSYPRKYNYSYGNLYWDEFGDAIPEYYYINQVKNRKLKLIEKIKIGYRVP